MNASRETGELATRSVRSHCWYRHGSRERARRMARALARQRAPCGM